MQVLLAHAAAVLYQDAEVGGALAQLKERSACVRVDESFELGQAFGVVVLAQLEVHRSHDLGILEEANPRRLRLVSAEHIGGAPGAARHKVSEDDA